MYLNPIAAGLLADSNGLRSSRFPGILFTAGLRHGGRGRMQVILMECYHFTPLLEAFGSLETRVIRCNFICEAGGIADFIARREVGYQMIGQNCGKSNCYDIGRVLWLYSAIPTSPAYAVDYLLLKILWRIVLLFPLAPPYHLHMRHAGCNHCVQYHT